MTKQQQKNRPLPAPGGWVASSARSVVRQAFAVFGLFLIIIAIPLGFLTPFLPIGVPIAIVGTVLLGRNSIWGRLWMESIMRRFPKVERLAPNWLMKLVFGREKKAFDK